MDRNALTALLLITLVLILTPYYMELVSPNKKPINTFEEEFVENNDLENIKPKNTAKNNQEINTAVKSIALTEEKMTTIETDLYIAKISSVHGGSIHSFKIKRHLSPDSTLVNLINGQNKRNLVVNFDDYNGEKIILGEGWNGSHSYDSLYINNETSLSYTLTIGENTAKKTITFFPDSYLFDISLDLVAFSGNMLGNKVSLDWVGGLPTTEKDTITDKTYFGAYLHQGGELLDVKAGEKESFVNEYKGKSVWVATRTKYFVASFVEGFNSEISSVTIKADNNNTEKYNLSIGLDGLKKNTVSLYLGPLEYERIKELDIKLEEIMNFGWSIVRPISKFVLWALKSMHLYIPNYGIILIIFSVLVKLAVYPLTKKSYESTRAMQAIQPEVSAIKEKYKNNPTKLNQKTMELYKKKGVNPIGGCLPMLLQMPLLFALFTVFRSTIELRGEPFVWWIKDLSAPDVLFYLPFKIPIYGDFVCALPVFMAVSMFVQQRMMTATTGGMQEQQQKLMQYFMMVFFFLLFNSFPSGLNLYYTLFNVLTIVQQKLTKQPTEQLG